MEAGAEARVRQSFARQPYMETLGAELVHVNDGEVDIALPFSERLVQQDGFLHAGVVAGATDSACGYAAVTRMDARADVLTVAHGADFLFPAPDGRGRDQRSAGRGIARTLKRANLDGQGISAHAFATRSRPHLMSVSSLTRWPSQAS